MVRVHLPGRLDRVRHVATRSGGRRASGDARAGRVATVVWVYTMFTRAPKPRIEQRRRMIVYFVGLLALATVLMTRNPMFFIFAITGFFHAAHAAAMSR